MRVTVYEFDSIEEAKDWYGLSDQQMDTVLSNEPVAAIEVAVDQEPEPQAETPAVTEEDVQSLAIKLMDVAGGPAAVKAAMTQHGIERLKNLSPEQLTAIWQDLSDIPVS